MNDSNILEDIYVFKVYYPKERKINYNDFTCLEIMRKIIKDKKDVKLEAMHKALLQIIKEEHYQLVYYDGHIPEFTRYLYEVIVNTVDIDPASHKFHMFLCDLIYWTKEYFHIMEAVEATN